MADGDRLLNLEEAAEILGIAPGSLRGAVLAFRIKAAGGVGLGLVFRESEVQAYKKRKQDMVQQRRGQKGRLQWSR